MRTRWLFRGGLVASVVMLGGCGAGSYLDPYQKPYAWHPTGAPEANIAAQLDNPQDLVQGRGTTEGDAKEAAQAVELRWQDKAKALPAASSSSTGGGS
jgi:type IV pilus biogenesis protein CpaD/CtpE